LIIQDSNAPHYSVDGRVILLKNAPATGLHLSEMPGVEDGSIDAIAGAAVILTEITFEVIPPL
jgi:hypothetical protein